LEYIYPCTTISANKKMLKYINLVCDTLKKINELKSICGSIEVYESYSFRLSNAKLSIEKNNKRIEILIDFSSPHERASFTCVEVLFNILGVKKQEIIERMAFLREKAFE
jgi:hypothetical protein